MYKQKFRIGTWFDKRFLEYRQFYSAYIALFIAKYKKLR
jgi:hypothetical protein